MIARPLFAALLATAALPAAALAAVPVVGCPADGMSGHVAAPSPLPAAPPVPARAARDLAFYAAPDLAVLAPNGWHCLDLYGSGGAFLLVTPRSYTADTLPGFGALTGPAVELSFLNGENSGREDVAAVLARLFPERRRFIRSVETEDPDHPHRFPRGPYAQDRTVRRSPSTVDYTTPPGRGGMGTFESRLRPGSDPIDGTATLDRSNGVDSVLLLNVRLPPGQRGLAAVILRGRQTPN